MIGLTIRLSYASGALDIKGPIWQIRRLMVVKTYDEVLTWLHLVVKVEADGIGTSSKVATSPLAKMVATTIANVASSRLSSVLLAAEASGRQEEDLASVVA